MSIQLENKNFSVMFGRKFGRPSSLRRPGDPFGTEWLATPQNMVLMATEPSIGFGVLQVTAAGPEGWSEPVRWPSPDAQPEEISAGKRSVSVTGGIVIGSSRLEATVRWTLRASELSAVWELHNPGRRRVRLGELGWLFPLNTNYGRCKRTKRNLLRMYRQQVIEHPYAGGFSSWVLAERVGREGESLFLAADHQTPIGYYDYDYIQYTDRIPFTDRAPYLPPARDKKACANHKSIGNHFPWPGVLRMFAAAESLLERHGRTSWPTPVKAITISAGETVRFGWTMCWLPNREHIVSRQHKTGQVGIRLLPSPVIPHDDAAYLAVACREQVVPKPGPGVAVRKIPSSSGRQCFELSTKRHGPSHCDLRRPDGRQTRIQLFGVQPLPDLMRSRARRIDGEQYFKRPRNTLNGAILIRHNPSGELVAKLSDLWGCGCYEGGICEARFLAEKNFLDPNEGEVLRLKDYAGGFLRKLHNRKTGEIYWWLPPAAEHRTFNYVHFANFYYAMYRLHLRWPRFGPAQEWLRLAMNSLEGMFEHGRPALLPIAHIGGELISDMIDACRMTGLDSEFEPLLRKLETRRRRVARVDPPRPANNGYDNVCLTEYAHARRLAGDRRGARAVSDIIISARGPQPTWYQYASEKRWWDAIGHDPYRHWTDLAETCLHYSVGINNTTLLDEYEATGDPLQLALGVGGLRGQWALIDRHGRAAMCFTPNPTSPNFGFNQYSGDAGVGLSAAVYNSACYVVNDPDFGWIALGGTLTRRKNKLRVEPGDAARRRVVVRELGLDIRRDQRIEHVLIDIEQPSKISVCTRGPGT